MPYQEQQKMKILEEQLRRLKKENEIKEKEITILKVVTKQKDEIIQDLDKNNYRSQCGTLKLENEELKKKLENLLLVLLELRNSNNKDSSNSCKPSSTNGFKKVIQNNREKTDRKPGREKGYISALPKFHPNPTKIIKVKTAKECTCGCKLTEIKEIKRQVIGMKIIVTNTEYKGKQSICSKCKKEYTPEFPKGVNNPINYDEKLKGTMTLLNTYANMPERVVSEIIGFLTNNEINLAPATVGNTVSEFHKLSHEIIVEMKEKSLQSAVLNSDETPIKVNGKLNQILGVFTKKLSILEAYEGKSAESFIKMNILNRYTGISCHDHNKIHNKFLASIDAECNFHVIRAAKEQYEIHKHESIKTWIEYMLEIKLKIDLALSNEENKLKDNEILEIKSRYLEILNEWDNEYNLAIIGKTEKHLKYFNDEKCLKNRLREYVDDHLRFIENFEVPFTNNLAERGFRRSKTKQKVAGGFRTLNGAKYYCSAMSIIDTCKKQTINVLDCINSIFCGDKKIFEFQKT